ncbi:hypothetical protein [Alistipes ihumii]|nr:hypothetical protein [Alistipes indistinctus]
MAGGPWIRPEQTMRHLVWSRARMSRQKTRTQLFCRQLFPKRRIGGITEMWR